MGSPISPVPFMLPIYLPPPGSPRPPSRTGTESPGAETSKSSGPEFSSDPAGDGHDSPSAPPEEGSSSAPPPDDSGPPGTPSSDALSAMMSYDTEHTPPLPLRPYHTHPAMVMPPASVVASWEEWTVPGSPTIHLPPITWGPFGIPESPPWEGVWALQTPPVPDDAGSLSTSCATRSSSPGIPPVHMGPTSPVPFVLPAYSPPPSQPVLAGVETPGAITSCSSGPEYPSDDAGDGPPGRGLPVALSVTYPRASIFTGLPLEVVPGVEEILSDRLSSSAHGSMSAALTHWRTVVSRYGWPEVIVADDPNRGGKLAAFVVYLVQETHLKATSIANYVWALRAWFKFQRQPDPVLGVLEWDDFMQSVQVVAWVASEPHKPVPLHVIRGALESVDFSSFWEVQAALLIVMMFFTFSRSENPLPKAFSGEGGLDLNKHLLVRDVGVRSHFDTPSQVSLSYVAMRLKSIKQDPRIERPEAAGGNDEIYVGQAEGVFDVLTWLSRFWGFFPGGSHGAPSDPFFRDRDRSRVLTYSNGLADVRALFSRVVGPEQARSYGLHGLRVEAYNRARAHDPLLAVAQGGWASEAHTRYARFEVSKVLALPAAMLSLGAPGPGGTLFSGPLTPPDSRPPDPRPFSRSPGPRLGRARSGHGAQLPSGGGGTPQRGDPPLQPPPRPRRRGRPRSKKQVSPPPLLDFSPARSPSPAAPSASELRSARFSRRGAAADARSASVPPPLRRSRRGS